VVFLQAEDEPPGVVVVRRVEPGSAAERAGRRAGDLVLGRPGAPFGYTDDLRRWVLTAPLGEPLELEVRRYGRAQTLVVELTR
jgi:serine protease Do